MRYVFKEIIDTKTPTEDEFHPCSVVVRDRDTGYVVIAHVDDADRIPYGSAPLESAWGKASVMLAKALELQSHPGTIVVVDAAGMKHLTGTWVAVRRRGYIQWMRLTDDREGASYGSLSNLTDDTMRGLYMEGFVEVTP